MSMRLRMKLRWHGYGWIGVLVMILVLAACGGGQDEVSEVGKVEEGEKGDFPMALELTSSAFEHEGMIPAKYTCDGQDISPPLTWEKAPEGTESFVLICDDPDAPGRTWVHWVLFNLPAETRSLPEAVAAEPEPAAGGRHGKNSWGRLDYGGPCPPSGTHRYFFKLYALDTPLDLSAGAKKQQVLDAMDGHILDQATLMGRYQKQ